MLQQSPRVFKVSVWGLPARPRPRQEKVRWVRQAARPFLFRNPKAKGQGLLSRQVGQHVLHYRTRQVREPAGQQAQRMLALEGLVSANNNISDRWSAGLRRVLLLVFTRFIDYLFILADDSVRSFGRIRPVFSPFDRSDLSALLLMTGRIRPVFRAIDRMDSAGLSSG
jgi:hypothetical protein